MTSDHGTIGILACPEKGFSCRTMEPPWKNNRSNHSCIPAGEYIVKIRMSPKYGKVYHVKDVDGRSYILYHSGNVGGDREKGLSSHTWGCILLGKYLGKLRIKGKIQRAVLYSKPTVRRFMELMEYQDFKLIITGVG
jgi:hypothetical protein